MDKEMRCPQCGCYEIGEGSFSDYGALAPKGKIFISSKVIAEVCTECGLIINLRVKKLIGG